jgi:prolyl-tRNA synthetase
MMNQWNNIVRWEKRTYMFLRTSEFLWQEGHTAHASHEEAQATQKWAIEMYSGIYRDYLALDGYIGEKSSAQKFAGADSTITFETLMPSGKSLQSCTSHDLGQNFSKVFGINFQDKDGSDKNVWQTSWGFSTRSIGGLIMAHGDENGLKLPPKLAPIQVVILPIRPEDLKLNDYAQKVSVRLSELGLRTLVDNRDGESFGWKINKWEVKGAPIRIEIGAREIEENSVSYVKRIDSKRQKNKLAFSELDELIGILDKIQTEMLNQSSTYLKENTFAAANYEEFKKLMSDKKGMIKVWWNEDSEVEAIIQKETKATSSCKVADSTGEGADFYTGKPANQQWYFAQSY